jgi:hypothetical protein
MFAPKVRATLRTSKAEEESELYNMLRNIGVDELMIHNVYQITHDTSTRDILKN